MTRKSFAALFIALAVSWFGVTPASAQDGDEGEEAAPDATEETSEPNFKTLTTKGAKAFKAKEYAKARTFFEKAYEIKQVPNLLYNMGRVSEKMGEFEEAISYYERFVNEPDIDIKARKDALSRIKTLREVVELRKQGEDVDKEEVVEKQSDRGLEDSPEPNTRVERDYTMAYIFTGAGVAALAGGTLFAFQTAAAHDDFENAQTVGERRDAGSRGQTHAILADSLFGVGAVLTGIGVYFFISPPEREVPVQQAAWRIAPSLADDGAAMTFTLEF